MTIEMASITCVKNTAYGRRILLANLKVKTSIIARYITPQFVQVSVNRLSSIAHGGRNGDSFPLRSPRRNCILPTCEFIGCYRANNLGSKVYIPK